MKKITIVNKTTKEFDTLTLAEDLDQLQTMLRIKEVYVAETVEFDGVLYTYTPAPPPNSMPKLKTYEELLAENKEMLNTLGAIAHPKHLNLYNRDDCLHYAFDSRSKAESIVLKYGGVRV